MGPSPSRCPRSQRERACAADLAKLPLRFEANLGQFDERVRFVARDRGIALFLTDDSATLALRKSKSHDADAVLALHIVGAQRLIVARRARVYGIL